MPFFTHNAGEGRKNDELVLVLMLIINSNSTHKRGGGGGGDDRPEFLENEHSALLVTGRKQLLRPIALKADDNTHKKQLHAAAERAVGPALCPSGSLVPDLSQMPFDRGALKASRKVHYEGEAAQAIMGGGGTPGLALAPLECVLGNGGCSGRY